MLRTLLGGVALALTGSVAGMPLPERLTSNLDGELSSGANEAVAISPGGRYLLFSADGTDMVEGDLYPTTDLIVRDRETGLTEMVSVWSDGRQATNLSFRASITDDGRYVGFMEFDDGFDPDDQDGKGDFFIRDRVAGTTARVPRPEGIDWEFVHLSGDGQRLVYVDMIPTGGSNTGGLDLETGELREMNVSEKDGLTRPASFAMFLGFGGGARAVSSDGRWTLLASLELLDEDPPGVDRAYLYDWDTGAHVPVCTTGLGVHTAEACYPLALSRNGRFVVFKAGGGDLGYPKVAGLSRLYLKDMMTGALELVEINRAGDPAGSFIGGFPRAQVSDDGRIVVFTSESWLLYNPNQNSVSSAIYVRDMQLGLTTMLNRYPVGGFWMQSVGDLSADGQAIVVNGPYEATPVASNVNAYLLPAPYLVPVDLVVELAQRPGRTDIIDVSVKNQGATHATISNVVVSSATLDSLVVSNSPCPTDPLVGSTFTGALPFACYIAEVPAGGQASFSLAVADFGDLDVRVQVRPNEPELSAADNDVTLTFNVPPPPEPEGSSSGGAFGAWLLACLFAPVLGRRLTCSPPRAWRSSPWSWACPRGS